jgi:acetate kinase
MPNPVILSVNAGSSSIKYSLYEKTDSNSVNILLDASISGLTAPPSQFTYTLYDTRSQRNESKEIESFKAEEIDVSNHEDAFRYFLEFLKSGKGRKTKGGVVELERISVVCHRIVHGGPEPRPLIITKQELHHLDELSDLAPLYLPTSLLIHLLSHAPLQSAFLFFRLLFLGSLNGWLTVDIIMRRC